MPVAELVRDFVEFGVNVGFSQEEAARLRAAAKLVGKTEAQIVRAAVLEAIP